MLTPDWMLTFLKAFSLLFSCNIICSTNTIREIHQHSNGGKKKSHDDHHGKILISISHKQTLLEAQRYYPNSALYLYFAGRISRIALDLSLSTQSFLYAADMTKKDWAEVPVANACSYEMALNHMITGNWEQAASALKYYAS